MNAHVVIDATRKKTTGDDVTGTTTGSSDVRSSNQNRIRDLVHKGTIPIHVYYKREDFVPSIDIDNINSRNEEDLDTDHFRIVPRCCYLEDLATSIMKDNCTPFKFFHIVSTSNGKENDAGTRLDDRFQIGILFDTICPDSIPWKLTLRKCSSSLDKDGEIEIRKDLLKNHVSIMKHAEYVETNGNIRKFSTFTRQDYKTVNGCISNRLNSKNENEQNLIDKYLSIKVDQFGKSDRPFIATRFHFKDGKSKVIQLSLEEKVFGICQGIVLKNYAIKDILQLKSTDNWLHISFPNATSETTDEKKVKITFRSVGGTSMIKDSVVLIDETNKVRQCSRYVKKQLKATDPVYLYLDGLFLVDEKEEISNLHKGTGKLNLYYSTSEAWL